MAQSRSLSVGAYTASTTQTQAGGTVLDADICVLTQANASDAFTIPANLPTGTIIYLKHGATNAGLLYPPVGGAINGGSVDASKPVDVDIISVVICTLGGSASTYVWNKLAALSA